MLNKKSVCILFFLVVILFSGFSDTIVFLIDSSGSMLEHSRETDNIFIRKLLRDNVRFNDNVHLLTFSGEFHVDYARTISAKEDLSSLLQRYFMQPGIGRNTNIIGAAEKTKEYIERKGINTPDTSLYILSDFIQSTGGVNAPIFNSRSHADTFSSVINQIKASGVTVHLVKIPPHAGGSGTSPDKASAQDNKDTQTTSDNGHVSQDTGPQSGKKQGHREQADDQPFKDESAADQPRATQSMESSDFEKQVKTTSGKKEIEYQDSELGETEPQKHTGRNKSAQDTSEKNPAAVDEADSSPSAIQQETKGFNFAIILYIILVLAGIGIAGFLLFLLIRLLADNLNSEKASFNKLYPLINSARVKSVKLVEMHVYRMDHLEQSTKIGYRNINYFIKNTKRSVGGRVNDYYVFLVPFPLNAGAISYDGTSFTFTIHKEKYFAANGSIKNCLNKKIHAIAKNGTEIDIVFKEYQSPLDRINRLMRSTKPDADN